MKRLNPEHIREIMISGGSLTVLMFLATGAFSVNKIRAMRDRSKRVNGVVASEKSGRRSLGIPLDGAHFDHYEGQHHPNYNKLNNGQLLTIYEHLQQHQQARLLPNQEGLPPEKQMLDNGLSVEGNKRAIELMEISVFLFEAVVFQQERDIEQLLDRYEQQGAQSATLDLDKIEDVIDETLNRYDHFRDLTSAERKQLVNTIQNHRQQIGFVSETRPRAVPAQIEAQIR